MTISDGTYLVINANSGLALDVRGASDRSGANVQQWSVNRGDAQIWALSKQAAGWLVVCSLTGKALDVTAGAMKDGANVQQWDDNGTTAQRWTLVADGKTVSYDGATYDSYVIESARDATFALDVSAGGTKPGTNVQIWTANGSDAQRWALVPVACMADGGTYTIHSALADDLVLDVAGGSTGNGANVQVYSKNFSNAQVWQASVQRSTQAVSLVRPDCGMAMDVNGGYDADGTNVQQWERNGSSAQRWLLVAAGTKAVDGTTRQLYEIRPQSGTGKALDVAAGKAAPATNVQVWGSNGSKAQRFWLEHASYTASDVPAPVIRGITPDGGYTISDALTATGDTRALLCIRSGTELVRARYRTVTHAWGGGTTTGPWRSLVDGSTSNGGWGDGWGGYDCGVGYATMPYEMDAAVASGSVRRVDLQVEAVGFVGSWGSLGASATSQVASATMRVSFAPTATISGAKVTEDGVAFTLASDAPTSGNVYTVEALGGSASSDPSGKSATVTVPWGSMTKMPGEDPVTVGLAVVTPDARVDSEATVTVSLSTTSTLSVSSTATDSTRAVSTVTYATTSSKPPRSAVVAWEGDGRVRYERCEISGADVAVPYPMGVGTYRVIATCDDGTRTDTFDSPRGDAWVWLWGDGLSRCARMRYSQDSRVSQTRDISYSATTQMTSGRRWPVVSSWPVKAKDLSVEGVVPARAGLFPLPGTSDRGGMVALSEALGQGWHPVFRSPDGDWERVAVTSVSLPQEDPRWCRCTVKQEAVSEDA